MNYKITDYRTALQVCKTHDLQHVCSGGRKSVFSFKVLEKKLTSFVTALFLNLLEPITTTQTVSQTTWDSISSISDHLTLGQDVSTPGKSNQMSSYT